MGRKLRDSALLRTAARAFLALDAFLNSSLFDSRRRAVAAYESISAFFDRFHVSGLAKFAVEMASDAPSFRATCTVSIPTAPPTPGARMV